jgi:AcrR family transcriptional regulator
MARAKTLRWERRPDDRPQELLDAALLVFARKGYRGTRLDDVANAAGVTKGTIYHYFATKEDLLLGVIQHNRALVFARAEDVLQDVNLSASVRIRRLVHNIFGTRETRGHLLALLIREIAHEVPRLHERWLREGPVRLWQFLSGMVDEGKARGEFRADADGEPGARILVSGLMLQLMWQQHVTAVPELSVNEDRLIDAAVDLFLAGLMPTGHSLMVTDAV